MNKKNLLKYVGGLFMLAMWVLFCTFIFQSVWLGLLGGTGLFFLEQYIGKKLSEVKVGK